jgi:two-component system chemotaxis response regulator CheY
VPVRRLRGNPSTAKLPILMVATRSVKDDILQAVQAGVSSYILKLFTPRVLKAKIQQMRGLMTPRQPIARSQ